MTELSRKQAALLGLVHGVAEPLPVSSSAHTTMVPMLLGWPYQQLDPDERKNFEVALHAGSAVALLWTSSRGKSNGQSSGSSPLKDRRTFKLAVVATLPSVVVGYLFEGRITRLQGLGPLATGVGLGCLALIVGDLWANGTRRCDDASVLDALILGGAQAGALVPGVSRSGAVLGAARARGFSRQAAFSLARAFSLPVTTAAVTRRVLKLTQRESHARSTPGAAAKQSAPCTPTQSQRMFTLLLGGATSFVSTMLVSRCLDRIVARRRLWPFALYRLALLAALALGNRESKRSF